MRSPAGASSPAGAPDAPAVGNLTTRTAAKPAFSNARTERVLRASGSLTHVTWGQRQPPLQEAVERANAAPTCRDGARSRPPSPRRPPGRARPLLPLLERAAATSCSHVRHLPKRGSLLARGPVRLSPDPSDVAFWDVSLRSALYLEPCAFWLENCRPSRRRTRSARRPAPSCHPSARFLVTPAICAGGDTGHPLSPLATVDPLAYQGQALR
jgi:hypothetical protein